jgi:hypothetical protein
VPEIGIFPHGSLKPLAPLYYTSKTQYFVAFYKKELSKVQKDLCHNLSVLVSNYKTFYLNLACTGGLLCNKHQEVLGKGITRHEILN